MGDNFSLDEDFFDFLEAGDSLRKQGYRGRFAPSPSGNLHLGNLRTALVSWLRARLNNGNWILRIDDLDIPRNAPGSIEKIQKDLIWLGLTLDGPIIFQSKRKKLYKSALLFLKRNNKLYPCKSSRKVLSEENYLFGENIIYSGRCRRLDTPWHLDKTNLKIIRLKVNQKFASSSGDIILRRSDGFYAYHLATVIDELSLGINEVIRGSDLFNSMNAQISIIDTLNCNSLNYKYVPLLLVSDRNKFSKRNASLGLEQLKLKVMIPSNVIVLLSSGIDILPKGSELNALELASEFKYKKEEINNILLDKV